MNFEIQKTAIEEVILIKPKIFHDTRGYFLEFYKESEFKKFGLNLKFVQDNFSYSNKNVIRGLHYQIKPFDQGKLVKVIKGRALDVAVDIRKKSRTFGKYISVELSDENSMMMWIPSGFAHGYCALSYEVFFLYKCTKEYSPLHERGIRFDDPELKINWNIDNPILSTKDLELPFLKSAELF